MTDLLALDHGMAQALVSAIPDCVTLLDADGILLSVNERWLEQWEIHSVGAIAGTPLSALWPIAERPRLDAAIAEAAMGGTARLEAYRPTPGGEPRWWDVRLASFQSGDSGATRIVAIARDVTGRLTAQIASRQAHAEAGSPRRGMPFGAWALDLETGDLATSATCRSLFGRDPAEAPSHDDLIAALHPQDRDRYVCAIDRLIATGAPLEVVCRLHTPAGLVRWVRFRGEAVTGAAGRTVRLQGTVSDTTARTGADIRRDALSELNDRFRATEDAGDIAFMAAEILGRTLGVSRAGYGTIDTVEETIDIDRDWNAPGVASIADRLHFRDHGSYIDDLKRGDTAIVADARIDPRTSATAEQLIAINARSFINMPVTEMGRFVALLFVNNDAPRQWTADELIFMREIAQRTRVAVERRRAELELHELNASLEARIRERTEELEQAHEALRQSQKMEAVGQLTGGLAHDFNNLLTGMLGNLELLQMRVAQGRLENLDRFVTSAQAAGRRAAALTQRLLAFSRRQTLDPKPTDVNKLVAGMEEMLRRTVGPAIDIEVVGAAGLWTALIDPGQLENALLNLCINARDAMPDGGRLTIETANKWMDDRSGRERDLTPGQYLSVCVTDTGTGMTPEIQARAFDPFFTTKPLGEGTGLGLSMIYGFARQSGGQVRLYSEVGKGTTMCIYLPRHHGEAEDTTILDGALPPPAGGGGETVLVVDDEPTIRYLIDEVLDELGYTVIGAADGAAGIKVLESGARIDLLITDVGLPNGMNGRQVADAARSMRPGLKVLFITGYAENAAVGNGHLEPGMELLTKPFSMDHLAQRVRDIVGGRTEQE